jgi:hypothetical protein
VSKTGFVGPNWVPNCVLLGQIWCVNWCSNSIPILDLDSIELKKKDEN